MLVQLLMFLVDSAAGFLTLVFLLRFILQWVKAPFRNPLGQFVIAVTDWAVRPLRRVLPGLFGLDMASLFAAWLVQGMSIGLAVGLGAGSPGQQETLFAVPPAPTFALVLMIAVLAVIALAKMACYVLLGAVLISAVLSWVNPHAPLADVINAVSYPALRPLRRWIPPLGGVDLSPLALLLLLQMLMMILDRLRWAVLTG
jgi:YggT family protein